MNIKLLNLLILAFIPLAQAQTGSNTNNKGTVCTPQTINGQTIMRCVTGTNPVYTRPTSPVINTGPVVIPNITPPAVPVVPPIVPPGGGPGDNIDPGTGINGGGTPDSSSSWGPGPVVGIATQLIPPPQGVPMMGSKIMLRPGDQGGPFLISGAGCGNKAYAIETPADLVGGNWLLLMMRPGYSMSVGFTPRQLQLSGVGRWTFAEHETAGRVATVMATISESPCDFNYQKMQTGDGCQRIWEYGYYLVEGMIDPNSYMQMTGRRNMCVLKPDKRYYLNVKWEDASRIGIDDCYNRQVAFGGSTNNFCAAVANP